MCARWTFNRFVRESGEPQRSGRGPLFWGDGRAEQRTEAGRGGELVKHAHPNQAVEASTIRLLPTFSQNGGDSLRADRRRERVQRVLRVLRACCVLAGTFAQKLWGFRPCSA